MCELILKGDIEDIDLQNIFCFNYALFVKVEDFG